MKKFGMLVAAIALIAGTSVANAADNLWFTAVSGGSAVTQGPGQALSLTATPGEVVTVQVNITSDSGGLNGWQLNLNSSGDAIFGGGLALGTGYDSVGQNFGDIGASGGQFGRGSPTASGSTGAIYQFTITVGNQNVDVGGDFGFPQGIYKNNGLYWYGFVGANPVSYGAANYTNGPDVTPGWGNAPVIHIAVPEPATLGLIGLGVVALIRRRK